MTDVYIKFHIRELAREERQSILDKINRENRGIWLSEVDEDEDVYLSEGRERDDVKRFSSKGGRFTVWSTSYHGGLIAEKIDSIFETMEVKVKLRFESWVPRSKQERIINLLGGNVSIVKKSLSHCYLGVWIGTNGDKKKQREVEVEIEKVMDYGIDKIIHDAEFFQKKIVEASHEVFGQYHHKIIPKANPVYLAIRNMLRDDG